MFGERNVEQSQCPSAREESVFFLVTPHELVLERFSVKIEIFSFLQLYCHTKILQTRTRKTNNESAQRGSVCIALFCGCAIVRDEDTTDSGQEPTKMYDSFQARIDADKTSECDERK